MLRLFLSLGNTERLNHVFMTSRLNYCNALLSGLPKSPINTLQLIYSSAVRVLTKTRAHFSPVNKSLHWLLINFRIDLEIILLFLRPPMAEH